MENGVTLGRRSFLKALAALAGVAAVPAIGSVVHGSVEPVKWIVQYADYDQLLAVGGQWGEGANMVRMAVSIPFRDAAERGLSHDEAVEHCKQALRQRYAKRGTTVRIANGR